MPVATPPPLPKPIDPPNVKINTIPIDTQVVDSRVQRYDTTVSFLQGYKWPVDIYVGVQARDSAPASVQADLPIPYGQLHLVRGAEIVVTSPPKPKQLDGAGRSFEAKGTGVIYGNITPQEGTVFFADMGDGRNAVFTISRVERMSMFQEAPYEIDFEATTYVTEAILLSYNERVVTTSFFMKENFKNGVKAIISQKEVDANNRLNRAYRRLIARYFRDFFSDDYQTFIMPMQKFPTYDPYVVRFMRAIAETWWHKDVVNLTELGMSGDVFYDESTLFDVILSKDTPSLTGVARKMGVASIDNYRALPQFASVYYSGVGGVISPRDRHFSVNQHGAKLYNLSDIVKAGVVSTKMRDILPHLNLLEEREPAPEVSSFIHRVLVDDHYVLSKAFYEQGSGQSTLENLLLELLDGNPVDVDRLADLAEYAPKFDNLERFYYVPIILAMIKLAPGVL